MKVLDLFSGIGGFSLGLEWAGMSTVAMCEKDPYCRKILAKHWPDLTIHEDIRNLDGRQYTNSIDLVCGGFPCQPFSVAGKQRGKLDDRHLWPEMLRVIKESKPRWVIGENVFGFINMALDDVQADLEKEHYEVRKFLLPAVAVDARHRRDRIILIAYSNRDSLWEQSRWSGGENGQSQTQSTINGPSQSMANANSSWEQQPKGTEQQIGGWSSNSGEKDVANSHGTRGEARLSGQEPWEERKSGEFNDQGHQRSWREEVREWPAEPCVGRVADGVPNRVHRIKGLGNAVVPQLIQAIGELVIQTDHEMRRR